MIDYRNYLEVVSKKILTKISILQRFSYLKKANLSYSQQTVARKDERRITYYGFSFL